MREELCGAFTDPVLLVWPMPYAIGMGKGWRGEVITPAVSVRTTEGVVLCLFFGPGINCYFLGGGGRQAGIWKG